jgi:hypothetical protein
LKDKAPQAIPKEQKKQLATQIAYFFAYSFAA